VPDDIDPDFPERPPEDFDDAPADIAEELRHVVKEQYEQRITEELGKAPRAINWRTLTPEDLETELLELNEWVDWLRHTYGLPAQIIPPMWHRHPELLWELSALKQHWLLCYDRQAKGNQAITWHNDFAIARERLRDWVTISGTRLDRDRPTRITGWSGGEAEDWIEPDTTEQSVTARTANFVAFVGEQVAERQAEQVEFITRLRTEKQ
jgi:hypothetical protein